MQKIKNCVLDKLMKGGLSRAEMDFILYISHYQDDRGRVSGIYYKDVCGQLNISYQTFYDVLHSLQKKEIIQVEKVFYGDWDIIILNNSFQGEYSGYVSTGDDLFINKNFQRCKPEEKLLAMEFLKIAKNPENGGKYRISKEKLQKKYCSIFGITKRVLMGYINVLKKFFSIGIKNGIYFIRPLQSTTEKNGRKDKELIQEQASRMTFRRTRATYTEESGRDTANLLIQYADMLQEGLIQVFLQAVTDSIRRRNEGIKNKYKWNRELNPKFIHKILREKLPEC